MRRGRHIDPSRVQALSADPDSPPTGPHRPEYGPPFGAALRNQRKTVAQRPSSPHSPPPPPPPPETPEHRGPHSALGFTHRPRAGSPAPAAATRTTRRPRQRRRLLAHPESRHRRQYRRRRRHRRHHTHLLQGAILDPAALVQPPPTTALSEKTVARPGPVRPGPFAPVPARAVM
jgi:hypothetical protein